MSKRSYELARRLELGALALEALRARSRNSNGKAVFPETDERSEWSCIT
jgi:hypothetical protein